jgi:hypothetical protein
VSSGNARPHYSLLTTHYFSLARLLLLLLFMTASKPKSRNKLLKRLIVVAVVLVIIGFSLHIWFVHNARNVLKNYISEQSGGKIRLELSELDLNIFTKKLVLHNVDLVSTDSVNQPITYHVKFNTLDLRVGSLWQLLINSQLKLDSIKLYDPEIQVMQWRKDTTKNTSREDLSIPQEMGKIYRSMIVALDDFGIRRIVIENAKFSLINKMRPESEPVTVSRIFLDLARPPGVGSDEMRQTLELRTFNQNIMLPGGRHRLAFKNFALKLFRERIEIDSCTVTAMPTDSLKSNYTIFFKKLSLTGVDFSAMSSQNVLRADSVYCEDPALDFNLYKTDAVKKKAGIPDADQIVRELTGNLDLAFVGVKNAGIHFDIYAANEKRSFYNSGQDNFEIRGIRINPDSAEAVSVASLDMTLRQYRLVNEDSTSSAGFDSLQLLNDKVILNNFFVVNKSGPSMRHQVDVKVPFFELTRLDWYALIFDQNLVANSAVLNNPSIDFAKGAAVRKRTRKRVNLFDALDNVGELVAIENLSVINGDVKMRLGAATSFDLEDLNFQIRSRRLLESENSQGIRGAVDNLSFSRGLLKLKDITAVLTNGRLTNNNLLEAERAAISSSSNMMNGFINDIRLNNIELDDEADAIEVSGLKWGTAKLRINSAGTARASARKRATDINLRNISGGRTDLSFVQGATRFSTVIRQISADAVSQQQNTMRVDNFNMAGDDLDLKTKNLNVFSAAYQFSGDGTSSVQGLNINQVKGRDSMMVSAAVLKFRTDLNRLFANDIQLSDVEADRLTVKMNKWDTVKPATAQSSKPLRQPLRINRITAREPEITIITHKRDSLTRIDLPQSPNSVFIASGVELSPTETRIGNLKLNTTSATLTKTTGEIIGVQNGIVNVDVSAVSFGKKDGKPSWSGLVNTLELRDSRGFSFGKKKNLRFDAASLGNISLSSEVFPDFGEMMKRNLSAWLRIPHGEFIDSNTTLKWFNASYSNNNRTLSLDSFIYHPTQPLDTVLARAPYELDYITLKTGAINIGGLDVAKYETDSAFYASTIRISTPLLTVFRDKEPPLSPIKRQKALPVNLIRKISLPVSVERVEIENGDILYTERNAKSREEGSFGLANVNGYLGNIRNNRIQENDSLVLNLNARLMNQADLVVNLKQSYTDTLSGFLLHGKVATTDLSILNTVLVPLSNVKISSGVLDSVTFTAVGRNDLAIGTMNMRYHDLKIKLIKAGDPNRSTFLQNVASFLANTFVVKRSNTKRTGVIYWERSPEQSFVNYIVKLTVSGFATSVGAKKNSKYIKAYKKQLKESGLPEVFGVPEL